MMHTYLGRTEQDVLNTVSNPYGGYLNNNIELLTKQIQGLGSLIELSQEDKEFMIENATARMINVRGLIGTPNICAEKMKQLQQVGVDEIACLIDFGIELPQVINSLKLLTEIKNKNF